MLSADDDNDGLLSGGIALVFIGDFDQWDVKVAV